MLKRFYEVNEDSFEYDINYVWQDRCKPKLEKNFMDYCVCVIYKVVQIWPGQTVTCLHTNSPGNIWTILYYAQFNLHISAKVWAQTF
jgi:hypothetical protein